MLIRRIMMIGRLPFCCNFCGNWRRWWMNADWPEGLVCLVISDTIASWPHVKPKYIMMMTRSSWSLWYWPCNSFLPYRIKTLFITCNFKHFKRLDKYVKCNSKKETCHLQFFKWWYCIYSDNLKKIEIFSLFGNTNKPINHEISI